MPMGQEEVPWERHGDWENPEVTDGFGCYSKGNGRPLRSFLRAVSQPLWLLGKEWAVEGKRGGQMSYQPR